MGRADRRWETIASLFHELLEMPDAARAEKLAFLSRTDSLLYRQLFDLLNADRQSHRLFNTESGTIFSILENDYDLIGSRIGAFVLTEVIGQGAMGTVFKAGRDDGLFDQTVAVKLMKPVSVNPSHRSLFERERQILAKLNHPNIARLYDGGFTEDERPFFTMEWVSGQNLIAYCQFRKLSITARLHLFEDICQAVMHAHQSLIVHLDLKPKNIVVTEEGQVKLLDFGVAQMLEEGTEQVSSFTLAYASPEQIEQNNPNTASDIYSLGVILFEMLVEDHPFETFFKDPLALKNAILAGYSSPFRLSGKFGYVHFAKDIGLICQKAMERAPRDRYASVDELIRDVRDFRNDYPVLARPKSWTYHTQKYLRRNRTVLYAVGVGFLLLGIMGIYYTFQLKEQRNIALSEARRANQITGLITDVFSAADPNIGGADTITAVQLLDKGMQNLSKNLGDDPALYADMLSRMTGVYLSLGQYEQAKQMAAESYAINLSLDAVSEERLAQNEVLISSSYFMFGELDSAFSFSQKAVNRLLAAGIYNGPDLADALLELGSCLYDMTRYEAADSTLSVGLELAQKAYSGSTIEIASFLHMKGATAMKRDNLQEAERYLEEALKMKKELYEEPHLEIAYSYNYFGSLYQNLGDYKKALSFVKHSLEQRRAILGTYHVETVASMGNLARTYIGLGKPLEAIPIYQDAISVIDSLFGGSHYYYGALNGSMGNAYFAAELFTKARDCYLISVESFDRLLSADDLRRATPRMRLGEIAQNEKRFAAARVYYEEALAIRERLLNEGDVKIAQSQLGLGACLLALGDHAAAISLFEKARLIAQSDPEQNTELLQKLNASLASAQEKQRALESASVYEVKISKGK